MTAKSNTGFEYDDMNSALNRHAISFQSGDISSLSEMVHMGNYFGVNNGSRGMMYFGNSSIINNNHPVISQAGNASCSSLLLDSVPGLKHDAGLAVEWSVDEQYKLEEGLVKYADEPSIMKYIKIAATLRDKTVRDVALRCRWMTRKRRKPKEKNNLVKKVNNRKDKPVESSPKQYLQSALSPSMATYSRMPHMDKSQRILYDGICGPVKQLLELNAEALSQITSNLCTYKDLATGKTIGVAREQGGLYVLYRDRGSTRPMLSTCHQISLESATSQIWLHHKSLGHPPFHIRWSLFPHLFTKGLVESLHCDVCQFAKHHRTTFCRSNTKSIEPFDLIHSVVKRNTIVSLFISLGQVYIEFTIKPLPKIKERNKNKIKVRKELK